MKEGGMGQYKEQIRISRSKGMQVSKRYLETVFVNH
jgi:hypothetical protein